MSDEKPKPSSGGEQATPTPASSRNRKQAGPPRAMMRPTRRPTSPAVTANSSGSSRRRRRRRRLALQGFAESAASSKRLSRDMLDAKLPESIFVYTHVLRSVGAGHLRLPVRPVPEPFAQSGGLPHRPVCRSSRRMRRRGRRATSVSSTRPCMAPSSRRWPTRSMTKMATMRRRRMDARRTRPREAWSGRASPNLDEDASEDDVTGGAGHRRVAPTRVSSTASQSHCIDGVKL